MLTSDADLPTECLPDGDADLDESASPPRPRKIIHIDMDAFFASVEQRDNPDLRGKPVAVGGARERGVVAAASYEAREFGVRSAMPSVTARRKCPDLIFVPPRFEAYKAVSRQIHEIFARYTPLIEPLSLDEAYLDVTMAADDATPATEIARAIRADIRQETGLTASAGVSYNKFLAKLASGQRKPDGLFVITPRLGLGFVESLPIGKFHGIGPATEAKMKALGIHDGADLGAKSLPFLQQHFGKSGPYYYGVARGIDERPVRADRERKSVGAEMTFAADLHDFSAARTALQPIIEKVWRHVSKAPGAARGLTLKVKYANFHQITRSRTVLGAIGSITELEQLSVALLEPIFPVEQGIRLLGVSLSSFAHDNSERNDQLRLSL